MTQYTSCRKISESQVCFWETGFKTHPVPSSFAGATHREIVLAAFVAGCHNREEIPMGEWVKYKDLVLEEDLDAVKKLGVLLRIAESLDRTQCGVVTGINCDVLGGFGDYENGDYGRRGA